ncbi:MAG: TatD family hydrolase [Paenibacillaceae bacterium]
MKVIDAHIHVDLYSLDERELLLEQLGDSVEAVIAVSMNVESCITNLELAGQYPGKYYPAFGYHPELSVPDLETEKRLFTWIREHQSEAIAIGEVGLPYYNRTDTEAQGKLFDLKPYIALLDQFIQLAAGLNKPIILHAVYEDADIVCDLLEKHGVTAAHFHWFKGSERTVKRMAGNGYYISITPDVCYEEEIRELVRSYPIEQLMVETDGPWPFEGKFAGTTTLPNMVRDVIVEIAQLKGMTVEEASVQLYENTKRFYHICKLIKLI